MQDEACYRRAYVGTDTSSTGAEVIYLTSNCSIQRKMKPKMMECSLDIEDLLDFDNKLIKISAVAVLHASLYSLLLV